MKNKGFTLIELVVAIAILGVITIIAIPSIRYIQDNNRDAKFVAYEKALTSAGKAYTDSYNEDLFGINNTGCAIIRYADLEEKDFIEDIQIKKVNCGSEDTYIIVRRSKNLNYHYEPHIACRKNSKIIYGESKPVDFEDMCKIEDGQGPDAILKDTSPYKDNPAYKKGQDPKIRMAISDAGVGLKADQKLKYEWFKEGESVGASTLYFKNKNYDPSIERTIPNVPNMSAINETTIYKLVVTGTVEDINNNKTVVNKELTIKYFVGKVTIKLKANGGKIKATSSGSGGSSVGTSTSSVCDKRPNSSECMREKRCKRNPTTAGCESYLKQLCENNPLSSQCESYWNSKCGNYSTSSSCRTYFKALCSKKPSSSRCIRICKRDPSMCKNTGGSSGGSTTTTTTSNYTIDSNDNILYNGNPVVYVMKEWESLTSEGLLNWNNPSALNMYKTGYSIKTGYEWNTKANGTGTSYNQTQQYNYKAFCNKEYEDCNITLYANWKVYNTYNINFVYQGYHAYFNGANRTLSCSAFDNEACTVSAPGISNLPATAVSGCGSSYSSLLIVQGWNTDPNAGTGVYGNLSVKQSATYYSIITPNPAYLYDYSKFRVYAKTCNSANNRNVVERSGPLEDAHPKKNDITCIKEGKYFYWNGGWAINGNYAATDKDSGAWFYLTGVGNGCRYAYGHDHAATTCQWSYIKAFQLQW
ncbi:MAG: type II secretion system protein [Bacilli bacterium]|nr:type II secretion system protein [Bacilli bacterium]